MSIIRDYVKRVRIDVQFADTEDKIRSYFRAKLENLRREWYFFTHNNVE